MTRTRFSFVYRLHSLVLLSFDEPKKAKSDIFHFFSKVNNKNSAIGFFHSIHFEFLYFFFHTIYIMPDLMQNVNCSDMS